MEEKLMYLKRDPGVHCLFYYVLNIDFTLLESIMYIADYFQSQIMIIKHFSQAKSNRSEFLKLVLFHFW